MKKSTSRWFGLALAAFGFLALPASAVVAAPRQAALDSKEVEVSLEGVFAPEVGYDDNDRIGAVLHGFLPNPCYKLTRTKVEHGSGNQIVFRQFATIKKDGICIAAGGELPEHIAVIVPFTVEATVGKLSEGSYDFTWSTPGGGTGQRTVAVERADSPNIDNLSYANVTQVSAPDLVMNSGPIEVTLRGVLNSKCGEVDPKPAVEKINDVYVILPVIRARSGGGAAAVSCVPKLAPFELKVELEHPGELGHFLIHVRSANGMAINHLFEVVGD